MNTREEQLKKLESLNWDTYWFYLVKPHSQQMTIKCLADAIDCMMPKLSDAVYTGQLHARMSHPPEIQTMLDICNLKPQEEW